MARALRPRTALLAALAAAKASVASAFVAGVARGGAPAATLEVASVAHAAGAAGAAGEAPLPGSRAAALGVGALAGVAAALAVARRAVATRSRGRRAAAPSAVALRANPVAVFETTMGSFKAEIFLDTMPITSSNFIDLAKSGFYNGVHFHRVIPKFMCQFGCPYAKDATSPRAGTGGPDSGSSFEVLDGSKKMITRRGGNIPDEFTQKFPNAPATLSMANTGKSDTGGSQFFMNVADNSFLNWFDQSTPSSHPVFGKITEGYDLVEQISQVRRDQRDNPVAPVKMVSITIQGL